MNTNDLPPAARLAALIEAGRSDPSVGFDGRTYYDEEIRCGCAMMFAARGAGVRVTNGDDVLAFIGSAYEWAGDLVNEVEAVAYSAATLDDVVESLREGKLALIAVRT